MWGRKCRVVFMLLCWGGLRSHDEKCLSRLLFNVNHGWSGFFWQSKETGTGKPPVSKVDENSNSFSFLGATKHLYKRVCPSVRKSVTPSLWRRKRCSVAPYAVYPALFPVLTVRKLSILVQLWLPDCSYFICSYPINTQRQTSSIYLFYSTIIPFWTC